MSATATWSSTWAAGSTHRDRAAVSPFDSAVQGGDAVWEGLRLHDGRIFRLDEHLARLRASARALAFSQIPSDEQITEEIRRTLRRQRHADSVHIRLTLTRGVKVTIRHGPAAQPGRADALIVLAEFKDPVYDAVRHHADHRERAPPGAGLPRPEDPPQQPAAVDPGQDRGERGRRRRRRRCSTTAASSPRPTPPTCSW